MWTRSNWDVHLITVDNQMPLRQEAVLCDSWPMSTDPAGKGMWLEGTVWDHVAGDQERKGGAEMPGKGCVTSVTRCAGLWQSSSRAARGFPRQHLQLGSLTCQEGANDRRACMEVLMLRLSISTSSSGPARMVSDKGEMAKS